MKAEWRLDDLDEKAKEACWGENVMVVEGPLESMRVLMEQFREGIVECRRRTSH